MSTPASAADFMAHAAGPKDFQKVSKLVSKRLAMGRNRKLISPKTARKKPMATENDKDAIQRRDEALDLARRFGQSQEIPQ
ncbi:hypothetical protein GCM10009425_41340 [Pseudomonas asuensis]|uniref:Uncharacterized protein n=1 Tax=Pseudomonas asuensis TaxID=1825787 RepID=A0ABQ2H394_9PSED|nr:hypothetical protein GCM10009425_41340 [Pseudomonas asuensis]